MLFCCQTADKTAIKLKWALVQLSDLRSHADSAVLGVAEFALPPLESGLKRVCGLLSSRDIIMGSSVKKFV